MSAVIGQAPTADAARWGLPLAALALVLASLTGLYWHTLVTMVTIWDRSATFTHCFLVLPISLWLIWRQRSRLAALQPRPQPWYLAAMVPMAALWMVGDMAGVNAATQFAFTALLVLAVPAMLGSAVAGAIAFPLGFLFFMVPLGEFMLPHFMEWTADFTVFAVAASGVPVYREGLNFVIPSGSWSVVEACSGIRYMIASLMVGTLFAYLNYNSLRRRLLFCLVAILVPLVANWLRAYMIVMLGHLSGNKIAVGVDHLIYGWVFFGVIILLMFMIGARWTEPLPAEVPATAGTGGPAAGTGVVALATVGVVAVLALPHLVVARLGQAAPVGAVAPLALPALGETAPAESSAEFAPVFKNPTATAVRSYAFEGGTVTVHVAFYRNQSYGRKLVSSENYIVSSDDKRWRSAGTGSLVQEVGTRRVPWRTNELMEGFVSVSSARTRRLDLRQTLWVGGRLEAQDSRAALALIASQLAGQGDDAAAITLFTQGEEPAQTRQRLDRFATQHLDTLVAHLKAYSALR